MAAKKTNAKKTTRTKAKARPAPKARAKVKPRPQAKKQTRKPTVKARARVGKSKSTTTKKPQARTTARVKAASSIRAKVPSPRRPPNNPAMPQQKINQILDAMNEIKEILEAYAAHLRSLDRKRLNGVGVKKRGFINTALPLAEENPEFLPHFVTLDKFREDDHYFAVFRALVDHANQLRELLWNITMESADIVYTDALEYYYSVKEAARRRVDAAESIFQALEPFFKRMGTRRENGEEPETKKKTEREIKGLLSGKRDGKIIIENIKPKLSGGVHKVIEEKFNDSAKYKETDEGEIRE